MTTLQVHDLRKVFPLHGAAGADELVAVERVSFEVPAGSCLAIVGESGSGKTTIARMVAGLETATSGSVTIDGAPRAPLPWSRSQRVEHAKQVQMVFQDPNSSMDPSQTIEQSLAEVLSLHVRHSPTPRSARIDELLHEVGLDARHRRMRPRRLSGGERQRAAIARALAVEPRLLILDEAVSALDVSVQAHVLNLLTRLRSSLGLTYLFISHDLGVVRQISDNVIVMRRGQVVERGSTDQVLDSPEHEYTQALLQAVPGPGWRPRRRSV